MNEKQNQQDQAGNPEGASRCGATHGYAEPNLGFDVLRHVAIPGVPGLEWRDHDGMKPGEVGFFCVYSPRTHKVTFTHLRCPDEVERKRDDGRDGLYYLWLGPLPPPPVYRAERNLD